MSLDHRPSLDHRLYPNNFKPETSTLRLNPRNYLYRPGTLDPELQPRYLSPGALG